MRTAVIIVNFNKKKLLQDCLGSLSVAVESPKQLIVVDNGSTDGSKELVKQDFSEVEMIEMGYNSGFCKANNEGINKALKQGFENVILLNNDTTVEADFIRAMEDCVDKENRIGMVAAQIVLMKNKDLIDSAGIMVTPDGLGKNRGHGRKRKYYQKQQQVFCPAGAAALFTRELLEDVKQDGKFLDEDYEFYLEEVDLGWRARLRDWNCVYQPSAVVLHLKRASTDEFAEKMMFLANRNIYFNIIKNYPSFYHVVKAIKLSVIRNLLLMIGGLVGKGVVFERKKQVGIFRMIGIYLAGVADVCRNLSKILKKRSKIQNNKRIGKRQAKMLFKKFGLSFFDSIFKL